MLVKALDYLVSWDNPLPATLVGMLLSEAKR